MPVRWEEEPRRVEVSTGVLAGVVVTIVVWLGIVWMFARVLGEAL